MRFANWDLGSPMSPNLKYSCIHDKPRLRCIRSYFRQRFFYSMNASFVVGNSNIELYNTETGSQLIN